jgi:hypothetical protein
MIKGMKQLCGGIMLLVAFLLPSVVGAAELSVSPVLLDLEVSARDVVTKDITLTNTSSAKLFVYATVNEILIDEGGQVKEFVSPVMTDRSNTVTSWVEITRGRLEFEPGETKTVPLTIRVSPNAEPGNYHAFIGFYPTNKRHLAEAAAMAGQAEGTIVKVAVGEKTNDIVRIASFLIDRVIFSKDKGDIEIKVENNGDAAAVPSGEIIFYNSRGEEVSSLPVNAESAVIEPGQSATLVAKVPFYESIGRFKANLVLRYGKDQQAAVFDTTQFFMIPLPLLIALFAAMIFFSLLVTYLLRRAFYDELHEDDEDSVPLYIRNDREHEVKDHDIHLSKHS